MNPNYVENVDRVLLKGILGLLLWFAGTLGFAWWCWHAPAGLTEHGGYSPTIWEVALGSFSVVFFFGIPVLFGLWIGRDFK